MKLNLHAAGYRLVWLVGASLLGKMSFNGALRLTGEEMPQTALDWESVQNVCLSAPLALLFAATVTLLASAFFSLARSGSKWNLVPGLAMVAFASALDGLSTREMLNTAYGVDIATTGAEIVTNEKLLLSLEAELKSHLDQVDTLTADMASHQAKADAAGDDMARELDPRRTASPGEGPAFREARDRQLQAESLLAGAKARLERVNGSIDRLRAEIAATRESVKLATLDNAKATKAAHILVTMAEQQPNPGAWLFLVGAIGLGVLELALAWLSWEIEGVKERARQVARLAIAARSGDGQPAPSRRTPRPAKVPGLMRRGNLFSLRIRRKGMPVESIPLKTGDQAEARKMAIAILEERGLWK